MLPEPDGMGYFVDVRPDVRLHVVTEGPHEGYPVIMLHGFPEFWWSWRFQLRFLGEAGFRAAAPDLRGFNLSDKPKTGYDPETAAGDIIGLMDAWGLPQAVIMGNDYGGIVAYVLAMLYPERVSKLVIMNALHPGMWPTRRSSGLSVRMFVALAKMGHWLGNPLMHRVNDVLGVGGGMSLLAHNRDALPHVVRAAYSRAYTRHHHTATAYAPATALWLMQDKPFDPHIPHPTLVLWSQNDFSAPIWVTRNIRQTVPQAHVIIIARAGHWIQQEQPDAVNAEILSFLQKG